MDLQPTWQSCDCLRLHNHSGLHSPPPCSRVPPEHSSFLYASCGRSTHTLPSDSWPDLPLSLPVASQYVLSFSTALHFGAVGAAIAAGMLVGALATSATPAPALPVAAGAALGLLQGALLLLAVAVHPTPLRVGLVGCLYYAGRAFQRVWLQTVQLRPRLNPAARPPRLLNVCVSLVAADAASLHSFQ